MDKILVVGARGQLGSELTPALKKIYGEDNLISADRNITSQKEREGIFEQLDIMDGKALERVVKKHKITQIYNLAALLSAVGEKKPQVAWNVNISGLLNVLNLALEKKLDKVYWPSSIAVFGPHTKLENTPQFAVTDPGTVYGISKLAGERWCEYYCKKHNLDVRSLRYPGLISFKTPPGGGTTDYAVDIFHKAVAGKEFSCFLEKDTYLPMMYMPDAIKATVQLMESPEDNISVRASYNISAMSFSPNEIAKTIKKRLHDFKISYAPDFRQKIAEGWPRSIDDRLARKDWHWRPDYDLESMTDDILFNLQSDTQPWAL